MDIDKDWVQKILDLLQMVASSPALPAVISGIIAYWAVDFVKEIAFRMGFLLGTHSIRGVAFLVSFLLFIPLAWLMGFDIRGINSIYGFLGGAVAIGYFHGAKAFGGRE